MLFEKLITLPGIIFVIIVKADKVQMAIFKQPSHLLNLLRFTPSRSMMHTVQRTVTGARSSGTRNNCVWSSLGRFKSMLTMVIKRNSNDLVEFASVMRGDLMHFGWTKKLLIVQVYVVIRPLVEAVVGCSSIGFVLGPIWNIIWWWKGKHDIFWL